MTTATQTLAPNFRELASAIAPRGLLRDPLGILAGYRAYRVYAELDAKSDSELAGLGITRADIPRVAFEALDRR